MSATLYGVMICVILKGVLIMYYGLHCMVLMKVMRWPISHYVE